LALPALVLARGGWALRFSGSMASRGAAASLLYVALPLVHVVAPRVGVLPSVGRALAATMLVVFGTAPLQSALLPLRNGASSGTLAAAFVASLLSLAAGIVGGPIAGASVSAACAAALLSAAILVPMFRSEKSSS
jgi:hypothetical protein